MNKVQREKVHIYVPGKQVVTLLAFKFTSFSSAYFFHVDQDIFFLSATFSSYWCCFHLQILILIILSYEKS